MTTNDSRRRDDHRHRPGTRLILIRAMAVVAGFLLVLAIAGPVAADALLVTSSPEDEALVTTPPTDVTLTFDENLDPAKSSFRLVRDGATIGTGKVSAANTNVMTLAGLSLAPGGYEVRWTAGSTDGHLIRGTLAFTVADPTPAPPTPGPSTVATERPAATPTAAPTGTPAPTSDPAPTAAPGEPTPVPASADALVPVVVGLVAVAAIGALVLRRSRRA